METVIQRLPLNTSSAARLNSYNHHALAPWLAETGYLTPSYLHRRERALEDCNMGRWLSPAIQARMLKPPVAVLYLSDTQVIGLLKVAAAVSCDQGKACANEELRRLAHEMEKAASSLRTSPPGHFFVRMSHCSPKDADGGNLLPVSDIFGALAKIVSSKRTVQALLHLYHRRASTNSDKKHFGDNQLYFFPYYTDIDQLSEWRCYIHQGNVVAISQSRFYQPNYADIADPSINRLSQSVRDLWSSISAHLHFDSCVLDVYAEVREPEFSVSLIEINPWGPFLGSGSLLFHWLDDASLLEPKAFNGKTVVRLVDAGEAPVLVRDHAYKIGRDDIIENELRCLRERGLEWVVDDDKHAMFMSIVPENRSAVTTRRDGLTQFLNHEGDSHCKGSTSDWTPRDHPRYLKLKKALTLAKAKPPS
jgi:hypothetical protein